MERAVHKAVLRPSDCVPEGAVLISTFKQYHRPLHDLQFRAVHGLQCLMSRVVLLCFGEHAVSTLRGACVNAPDVPQSDFREGSYFLFSWVKWNVAWHALNVASCVLMIDADVVVLRNPFTPEIVARREDLLYQLEHHGHDYAPFIPSTDPSARVPRRIKGVGDAHTPNSSHFLNAMNSGQLFVRSQPLVERVLQVMPASASADPRLEQVLVFMEVLAKPLGFQASGLPASFASKLWYSPTRLPWRLLLTYHTNSPETRNVSEKVRWMQEALAQARLFGAQHCALAANFSERAALETRSERRRDPSEPASESELLGGHHARGMPEGDHARTISCRGARCRWERKGVEVAPTHPTAPPTTLSAAQGIIRHWAAVHANTSVPFYLHDHEVLGQSLAKVLQRMEEDSECLHSLRQYAYAGEYWFLRRLVAHPWRTWDAGSARVLVLPVLLGIELNDHVLHCSARTLFNSSSILRRIQQTWAWRTREAEHVFVATDYRVKRPDVLRRALWVRFGAFHQPRPTIPGPQMEFPFEFEYDEAPARNVTFFFGGQLSSPRQLFHAMGADRSVASQPHAVQ